MPLVPSLEGNRSVLASSIAGYGPPNINLIGELGQLYFDKSVSPAVLYIWNGTVWIFEGGTGNVNTITTADSSVVFPVSGNINLIGSGSITTVGSGSTATVELTGLTAHDVLVGAGTTTITKVAPSATVGVPFVSAGAAVDPVFGTASVAGGGTGAVTLTGLVIGNGTSAFTTDGYTVATAFTPAFSLATPGDSVWTYTSQIGRYTRLGSIVYFSANVAWSNFVNTTGSGVWRVSLPVASGAFVLTGQASIQGSGIDAGAETANLPANFYGKIGSAVSVMPLSVQEGGIGNAASASFDLTVTQVLTAGTLTISGFYFVA